jgi:hypothetical protein
VAAGVAVVADQLTSDSANPLVVSASFLPMAAAMVALGARLLRGADRPAEAAAPVPAAA